MRGLVTMVAGILTVILGYGAWRSPHLDWESFTQTFTHFWVTASNELVRMTQDPFSFIGLVVMIVGLVVMINGVKKLAFG